MAPIETVRIDGGDSYIVINKSDYDPAKHKLYDPAAKKPKAPKAPAAAE